MRVSNSQAFTIDELKNQFEQLAQHIPMAVAMFDQGMRYLFANPRWITDYGLDQESLIGKSHYDVFQEIGDDWKAIHQRCLAGEVHCDDAVPFPRFDGSLDWIRREIRPWHTTSGTIGGLMMYTEVITERKQAQDAFEAQHKFLRQVIDLNTSFIFAKDEEGRFTLVNKALADAYGSSWEDMVGKYDSDFNPNPDETTHFRHDDREVIRSRTPKFIPEEPVTNVGTTGETRWYQTIKVPLISEDGASVQLLGIATDITDRKRGQDELERQQKFLRQVIDLHPGLIFAKDRDGNFTLVNKSLADDFGVTPEQMVGKSDIDFNTNIEQVRNIRNDDFEVLRTRTPKFVAEEPITSTVTGETRWFQTTKVPIVSGDDDSVQLLGVSIDITERKRAQDALQAQHTFLRQVIDLNTSFIFAKDEHGRYTLVNKALADHYGSVPELMVGKYDEDYNPKSEETVHFRRDDREVVQLRQPKFIPEEPVSNAITGETRWYQTIKVPLVSKSDDSVQLLGIATDITERKRAEEQLQKLVIQEQQARRVAEDAAEMKDLFMANMSHELRTPMNAIIGFLREMLYSEQLNHDNYHMAERCLANSKRLLLLINSVLDLSRLASGSLEIFPAEISPSALAHQIIEDLKVQAKEKGLVLDYDIDSSLPQIITHDEERLTQITTNLLVNAIKFTDSGTVKLRLKRHDDRLIIAVTDTGIGIPPDRQAKIFEDFVQLDATSRKKYGGAGLGLSIVKNLVDLMGGTVSVESEVGSYTVFTVDIPLTLT